MTGRRGFHSGELAVQAQAGVTREAARLEGMLDEPELDGGAHKFLAHQTFIAMTGRDAGGVLWTTAFVGEPGFLGAHGHTLEVHAVLRPDDPLADLAIGTPVGVVAIDLAARRRMRINGTLVNREPGLLVLDVAEAFGNCPQYIQQRVVSLDADRHSPLGVAAYRGSSLTARQHDLIRSADTFFLGTTHQERGSDASHRGGPSGFVRVDGDRLRWPDYAGNNMFNSFGNLAVDPEASLVFVDFATGETVHLAGTATVVWTAPGAPGDDGRTGRQVEFVVDRVAQPATPLHLHASDVVAYPRNPPIDQ